jgi:hypothetical protein
MKGGNPRTLSLLFLSMFRRKCSKSGGKWRKEEPEYEESEGSRRPHWVLLDVPVIGKVNAKVKS